MFMQPRLSGRLVQIAPTQPSDYDALYAVARDPLIWEQHPAKDRWKPDVFKQFFETGLRSAGALTIRDAVTDEVIGSSRYYWWNADERHVSIGYTYLARRCWGGTYNHEMKRLMLVNAFTEVDRVWFHIGSNNIRSRRAIEAIGAALEKEIIDDPAWNAVSMAYYFIDKNSRFLNERLVS